MRLLAAADILVVLDVLSEQVARGQQARQHRDLMSLGILLHAFKLSPLMNLAQATLEYPRLKVRAIAHMDFNWQRGQGEIGANFAFDIMPVGSEHLTQAIMFHFAEVVVIGLFSIYVAWSFLKVYRNRRRRRRRQAWVSSLPALRPSPHMRRNTNCFSAWL